MLLGAVNWSLAPSPPISRPPPPSNKMSLSNILRSHERRDSRLSPHGQFSQTEQLPSRAIEQHLELDDSSDESSYSTSSTSIWTSSREDTDGQSDGSHSGNPYSPSTPLNPSIVRRKSRRQLRSATIYSRKHRQDPMYPPFGIVRNGRHYCTYIDVETRTPCAKWEDGYTSSYDLVRHADAEHGPEEVALIEQGLLDHEGAQWIRTKEQLDAIKRVSEEMVCADCGRQFSSNRQDSKERHKNKGACQRLQEKKRKLDFEFVGNYPKRKGGKTSPTNKRR